MMMFIWKLRARVKVTSVKRLHCVVQTSMWDVVVVFIRIMVRRRKSRPVCVPTYVWVVKSEYSGGWDAFAYVIVKGVMLLLCTFAHPFHAHNIYLYRTRANPLTPLSFGDERKSNSAAWWLLSDGGVRKCFALYGCESVYFMYVCTYSRCS